MPFPFLKVAETEVAAPRVTVHVRVAPEQPPPLQPVNVALFLLGAAASVTAVPLRYASEQSEPQVIPAGVLVTVPGPDFATVRLYEAGVTLAVTGTRLKLAPMVAVPLPVKVHEAVPEQRPPLQPSNVEPEAGVAARVTTVPAM